jgi:hypothetical protein
VNLLPVPVAVCAAVGYFGVKRRIAMTFSSIIDFTRTHPYAYLGQPKGDCYARLVGFITGYAYGVREGAGDTSKTVMPEGFNDFVKGTLNSRHPSQPYGPEDHWSDVILREAGSDEAAFNLFYEMWEKCSQSRAA